MVHYDPKHEISFPEIHVHVRALQHGSAVQTAFHRRAHA